MPDSRDDSFPLRPAAPAPPPALTDWWSLRCGIDGRFCTVGMIKHDDGHIEMAGPFLAFMDRDDAEREAVAHRETYPWLMITAERLPLTPPARCRPLRHDDETVIATQVVISRGGQSVQVEVRTATLTDSAELASDVLGQVMTELHRIPHTRVGPVGVVTLGPRAAQVSINGEVADAAADDKEAA